MVRLAFSRASTFLRVKLSSSGEDRGLYTNSISSLKVLALKNSSKPAMAAASGLYPATWAISTRSLSYLSLERISWADAPMANRLADLLTGIEESWGSIPSLVHPQIRSRESKAGTIFIFFIFKVLKDKRFFGKTSTING